MACARRTYYGYIQDEFKVRPNFTLNLGLRYSFFNIFHEVQGRANPFDFATCGPQGFCGVGASFGQPNYGDLDPRIAFAWAPRPDGRTVVRAGFGIYHEDGQLDDQNLPISNEVFAYSLSNKTIPNLSYPIDPFLVNTPGIISPRDDDRRRKDMYVEQWGLSVQQSLPADFVGTISYVGSTRYQSADAFRCQSRGPAHWNSPVPCVWPGELARQQRHQQL